VLKREMLTPNKIAVLRNRIISKTVIGESAKKRSRFGRERHSSGGPKVAVLLGAEAPELATVLRPLGCQSSSPGLNECF
jgi:hypothetical protein